MNTTLQEIVAIIKLMKITTNENHLKTLERYLDFHFSFLEDAINQIERKDAGVVKLSVVTE